MSDLLSGTVTPPTVTTLTVSTPTVTTLWGDQIGGVIASTAHVWTADATGLFHTSTNLATEWQNLYAKLLNDPSSVTGVQRLEANAQAVFLNTGLNNLSAAQQEVDREDAQREFDAVGAEMAKLGLGVGGKPLTDNDYIALSQTLRADTTLEELAVQGHGLNSPPEAKYNGYTNDFQNNVDNKTLYIGGGLDTNEAAIPNLFDDLIMTHLPFPEIAQNGHVEQINQNANSEDVLSDAVGAMDQAMFVRTYTSADFSTTPGAASSTPVQPPANSVTLSAGQTLGFFGGAVDQTLTVDTGLTGRHVWVQDGTGTFQLNNLSASALTAEWKADYAALLAGNAAQLSGIQRLEGNAEAVFENTGLAGLTASKSGNVTLTEARADTQRVFDAMAAAMKSLGIDGKTALTADQYRAIEKTLQSNADWEELALQGVGIESTGLARYDGYDADFQNVDTRTLFEDSTGAAGLNNGERAVPEFFADNILGNMMFPSVARNGELIQLNNNGSEASTFQASIDAINTSMSGRVYTAVDFNIPGARPIGATEPVAGTETTLWGVSISTTIVAGGHTWVADASGRFNTTTDLAAEWKGYYATMLNGGAAGLSAEQRWEGNAEAVFENTGLAKLSAAQQQIDRMDAQREFDAVTQTIRNLGLDPTVQLTNQSYVQIEKALQANVSLEELAVQGHGLNSPPLAKYNGYTNDFQHNVDGSTDFVGGGLDNGQNALTDFFDDVIMTHIPYPTIAQNGTLEQLNQNAADEDLVATAVGGANEAMFTRVFVASDFSKVATAAGAQVFVAPPATPADPVAGAGQILTREGFAISDTITSTVHQWKANSDGLFQTSTDLILEWYNLYQQQLAGQDANFTVIQRLEANAEAVFENTGLARLSEAQQMIDRMDLQREFDANYAVLQQLGFDKLHSLTADQYLAVEHTLQTNTSLEELAIQGHGLNSPPSVRYRGYTNDFQNNVDQKTLYIGPGNNTGERAIADFLDDSLLSHVPFATVAINGELVQLNQNGDSETKLTQAAAAVSQTWFKQKLDASDFGKPGYQAPAVATVAPSTITTYTGFTVSGTISDTPHLWVADANGLYQTSANLEIEWRTLARAMAAGATLTTEQRLEANAEMVFENTGLANQSEANLVRDRMDAQREFDAIAATVKALGLDPNAQFSNQTYLQVEQALIGNAQLEELAVQGHGFNAPSSARYNGYTNDFQNNVDNTTLFVGGGNDNGQKAIAAEFDDNILSHLPFPTVAQNGTLEQLNQNGNDEDILSDSVAGLNRAMFQQKFVADDFSQVATHVGKVVLVSPAPAAPPAAPVAGAGQILSLTGFAIPSNLSLAHQWTADANGLFQTSTDLNLEWYNLYQQELAGQGGGFNWVQRMEANAEAVFENTGLANLSEAKQMTDRADLQRVFDATYATLHSLGYDTLTAISQTQYLTVEHALQSNAALEELAVQGFGLNGFSAPRYQGYVNDFQNNSDGSTLFVGVGATANDHAVASFISNNLLGDVPFAAVAHDGRFVQLSQNGTTGANFSVILADVNQTWFGGVLKASDFSNPSSKPTTVSTSSSVTTLTGETVSGTITITPHVWVANGNGLYQTSANLEMEWRGYEQIMLAGHADTLTAIQRLEGNAEAVFENTGLINQSESIIARDRMDVQRAFDAMAAAMTIDQASYGIDPTKALTAGSYVQLERTINANDQLSELAVQGHGLNSPPSSRYNGYTNDFQNNVDNTTLFIGGGLNNNGRAIADFFDDNVLSHTAFSVVSQNGTLEQLNQNGDVENTLQQAVVALDDSMYTRVYTKADFSKTASTAHDSYVSANTAYFLKTQVPTLAAGQVATLYGQAISNTIDIKTSLENEHVWTETGTGAFQLASIVTESGAVAGTLANLQAEWFQAYQAMQSNHGASLSLIQRMEGNAEATFIATGIFNVSAAKQFAYMEDVQRQIDAEAQALAIDHATLGLNLAAQFTTKTLMEMERTIQDNASLQELAIQGHGLNSPSSARYNGYTNDFQNGVNTRTNFVGGGADNNQNALTDFFDDVILGHAPFPTVWHNGKFIQLNQNAADEVTLSQAVTDINETGFTRTFKSTDFK